MSRRAARWLAALGASAALLLGAAPASAAPPAQPASAAPWQADRNDFSFGPYRVDYRLSRDPDGAARLETEERFVALFPEHDQNRGIVRAIPLDYNGVPLHPEVTAVTDGDGRAVPYETDTEDGYLMVGIGDDDYQHGRTEYVLRYEQVNTARAFADTRADEFYWDTTGIAWEQPFASAEATLRVDPELVPSLTGNAACYRGAHGDTARCEIGQDPADPGVFRAASGGPLQPNQTMTLAVGFAPGTFVIPEAPEPPEFPAGLGWLSGALAAAAAGSAAWLIALRRRLWPHAPGRGVIIPEYAAPAGVSLLEAGALAVPTGPAGQAALIDLAVRGAIRIIDVGSNPKKPKIELEFCSDRGLAEDEIALLDAMFGGRPAPGQRVPANKASESRGAAVGRVLAATPKRLIARGWQAKPGAPLPLAARILAPVLAALLIAAGLWGVSLDSESALPVVALIAGIALLVIACLLLIVPVRRTPAGQELWEALFGVRDYVRLAERDRFAMLQSVLGADRVDAGDGLAALRLNERLLPYAVLWGMGKDWAGALGAAYDRTGTEPDWFASDHLFTGALFAHTMGGMESRLGTAMSAPGSEASGGSFSGGSTGGGFAGGGGGGGGGGGR